MRLLLSLLVFFSFSAAAARAGESASCEVPIIQAFDHGEGIDPQIVRLRPYLQKPPFTAWKSFKLLASHKMTLSPKESTAFDLPGGRRATLTFVEHDLSATHGHHHMRLNLLVKEGERTVLDTSLALEEGGVVLHASNRHQGGLIIIGVSCKTQD
jgi:hypothetical protein